MQDGTASSDDGRSAGRPAQGLSAAASTFARVATPLTDDEVKMLQFEQHWWRSGGAKDQAIRTTFGLHPIRYYQRLHALVRRPEALAAQPHVVRRLLAQADQRSRRVGPRAGA